MFDFSVVFFVFFKTGLRRRGREGRVGEDGRSAVQFLVFSACFVFLFFFDGLTRSKTFIYFSRILLLCLLSCLFYFFPFVWRVSLLLLTSVLIQKRFPLLTL